MQVILLDVFVIRQVFLLEISQGNCMQNHLIPKILRGYSGLHLARFLLLGTPNFSDVSALSKPNVIFFTNEQFLAA